MSTFNKINLSDHITLTAFMIFSFLMQMVLYAGTDTLTFSYTTISENDETYNGAITVANINTAYTWNGSFFDVRSIRFQTTSEVTDMTSENGTVTYSQDGEYVWVDLGWQSLFDLNTSVNLTIQARKQGQSIYPHTFIPYYVRGRDIRYPAYAALPATWYKGKTDLTTADLITDTVSYYDTVVHPVAGNFILYTLPGQTQIQIGQVDSVPYPVNAVNGLRIWIPTKLMAMGIGVALELFKINPNYLCALGTKENYAAGVVKPEVGNRVNPVEIDGTTWYWPIVAHVDGPYQQETGNFTDCCAFFPDFLPPNANHDEYTAITVDFTDPNWISSGISSALSITVTREYLHAIFDGYNQFMDNAADPWAEFSIVTYAYNRGVNDFLSKNIFTDNREAALASSNIADDFGMGGFADHVPTVKAITDAMNNALYDIYDAAVTWEDMNIFFPQLREFYARGIPNDTEWNAMIEDVQRAFNVLVQHWDGSTISLRFDFLTILRIIKQYLPQPYIPRPTGSEWYYQVNANLLPTHCKKSGTYVPVATQPNLWIRQHMAGHRIVFSVSGIGIDAPVMIRICTAAGRVVQMITLQNRNTFSWECIDRTGHSLPSGIYFAYGEYMSAGGKRVALPACRIVIQQ